MTTFASTKVSEEQTLTQWMGKYNDLADHLEFVVGNEQIDIPANTDYLTEGPTNLYYTDARVITAVQNTSLTITLSADPVDPMDAVTKQYFDTNVPTSPEHIGAPQTDGTGATGTWAISISGNAATVTNGVYTSGNQTINGVLQATNVIATQSPTTSLNALGTFATPVLINTAYTASVWDWLYINTSSAPVTITMPTGTNGDKIRFTDFAGTWATNNVVLTGGTFLAADGTTILEDFILDISHFDVTAVFLNDAWRIR